MTDLVDPRWEALVAETEAAETDLLGRILRNPSGVDDALPIVTPAQFFNGRLRAVWVGIGHVLANGEALTAATLWDQLEADGATTTGALRSEKPAFLTNLAAAAVVTNGVRDAAERVVALAARRAVISEARLLAQDALDGVDLDVVRKRLEDVPARVAAVARSNGSAGTPAAWGGSLRWRSMPLGVLPPPLRAYATEAAASLSAAPEMIALPLLAACSAAIGNSTHVLLSGSGADDFTQPPALWSLTLASSGDGKTPCMTYATRFASLQEAEFARRNYERQRAYQREKKEWVKNKNVGDEPERPPNLSALVEVTTIQAACKVLRDNPRGLLLVGDEAAAWFRSFDEFKPGGKGSDLHLWCKMHEGKRLKIDRTTDGASVHVPSALIAVALSMQPRMLPEIFTERMFTAGLPQRFMLARPPMPDFDASAPAVRPETRATMRELSSRLYAVPLAYGHAADQAAGHVEPVLRRLSEGASQIHRDFANETGRMARRLAEREDEQPINPAGLYAKARGHVGRVALVLHECQRATENRVTANDPIAPETMERAVELERWLLHEASRLYLGMVGDVQERERREVVAWVQAQGEPVGARDLKRHKHPWKDRPTEAAEAVLADLARRGELTPSPGPKANGKPTVRYRSRFSGSGDK